MSWSPFCSAASDDRRSTTSHCYKPLDVTSIVDAFESGSFHAEYGEGLRRLSTGDVKHHLAALLRWLATDFMPSLLAATSTFSNEELKECRSAAVLIKQKFNQISKLLNTCKKKEQWDYTFNCAACGQAILQRTTRYCDIWCRLQQHEHIEERLIAAISTKECVSELLEDSIALDSSLIMDQSSDHNGSISSIEQDVSVTSNTEQSNFKKVNQSATMENDWQTCCVIANNLADFKFNFQIGYHSAVDRIYSPKGLKEFKKKIDKLDQPMFQFKSDNLFTCLLCCCDMPVQWTPRTYFEHLHGNRHSKKKKDAEAVKALSSYHEHWKQQELVYQVHQTYFIPFQSEHTICTLCQDEIVSYDSLVDHLSGNEHERRFTKLCRRKYQNQMYLLPLQKYLYSGKPVDYCSEISDEENESIDEVNGLFAESMSDKDVASEVNTDNPIPSTSRSSDFEASPRRKSEIRNTVIIKPKSNGTPSKEPKIQFQKITSEAVKVDCNASKETEIVSQFKNCNMIKLNNHVIVKSVLNPKGLELADMLENRFLPHLKFFEKTPQGMFQCNKCYIVVNNTRQHMLLSNHHKVTNHICSWGHRRNTNLHIVYHHFCEICDTMVKDYKSWKYHLISLEHLDRVDKIATNRKETLTQYECKTCKLIIYGDEVSLRRHSQNSNRIIWPKRKDRKDVTLCPATKSLFLSEQFIQEHSLRLVKEAKKVLLNFDPTIKCLRALEAAVSNIFPGCKAYPFGSRVSGLGSNKSDLDVFMDLGDMYLGHKNQDARSQEKFVSIIYQAIRKRKNEFESVNSIPTARTPIVQAMHTQSGLDCDISFRHGLSVENTKFLKLCIDLQPVMQATVLLLKQWVESCKLNENITTYALSMMVVFYLQVKKFLMPVHELRRFSSTGMLVIDGWGVVDCSKLNSSIYNQVKLYDGSIKTFLIELFSYYSSFDYAALVICPLLGYPINKSLFCDKPNGEDLPLEMLAYVHKVTSSQNPEAEYFRARSPFCIQDPFDLSHNLVKACRASTVEKFKTFCDLTAKYLRNIP